MSQASLDTLPPLRDVIANYELAARKSLGQHFLLDLNLTRRIVAQAGDLTDMTVYEIGPGPGGLTRALLESNADRVIVIEKDPRCIGAMQDLKRIAGDRLDIIEGDALKVDLINLAPAPRAIIANLPYNVGTPLLIGWLKQLDQYKHLTLMLQEEVVDRLIAAPDTDAYGRLSVITQFCASAKKVMRVPASAFTPPPKVDSAIVHIRPRTNRPTPIELSDLEAVTAAAFSQRRKMLRSSLKIFGGENWLKNLGINPQARAETLSLADFERLAANLPSQKKTSA